MAIDKMSGRRSVCTSQLTCSNATRSAGERKLNKLRRAAALEGTVQQSWKDKAEVLDAGLAGRLRVCKGADA